MLLVYVRISTLAPALIDFIFASTFDMQCMHHYRFLVVPEMRMQTGGVGDRMLQYAEISYYYN